MSFPQVASDQSAAATLVPPFRSPHWTPAATHWSAPAEPADPTILVVDNSETNRRLLRGILKACPYRILECARATDAMKVVEDENVDLVISEMMLPEMSGSDFCRWLRANGKTKLTPILMMSGAHGVENEIAGINSGADEFLIHPLHPALVRTRIRAMLRNKALIDSLDEAETILFGLALAVEGRDRCTGQHCQRLALYSVLLGQAVGLSSRELTALHRGGYLHDIGKICVPDAVLFKPGSLSDTEWEIMRQHTLRGEEICQPMKSLASVLPIVRSHHERWDGSGYPDGRRQEETPLLARILQIADIYDALTSARPYKLAMSQEEALQVLSDEVRRGWRDPELVALFANMIRTTPPCEDDATVRASLANMRVQLAS